MTTTPNAMDERQVPRDALISRKDVTALTGISSRTVTRYEHDGRLPHRAQIDGVWHHTVADLLALQWLREDQVSDVDALTARVHRRGDLDGARAQLQVAEEHLAEARGQLRVTERLVAAQANQIEDLQRRLDRSEAGRDRDAALLATMLERLPAGPTAALGGAA